LDELADASELLGKADEAAIDDGFVTNSAGPDFVAPLVEVIFFDMFVYLSHRPQGTAQRCAIG